MVTDAGNGLSDDHVDWVNPTITCQAAPPATPAHVNITFDRADLQVLHKHSATLNATFSSTAPLNGPLTLRLERAVPGVGFEGMQLRTTSVAFTGPGSTTRPLTIAAPMTLLSDDPAVQDARYRVVASVNGQDVGSQTLNIDVKSMKVSTRVTPLLVSGHDGETATTTVEVTVAPPLEGPASIDVIFQSGGQQAEAPFGEIVRTGPTTVSNSVLRATVTFKFSDVGDVPDDHLLATETLNPLVNDETGEELFSYRRPAYGSLYTGVQLQLLR